MFKRKQEITGTVALGNSTKHPKTRQEMQQTRQKGDEWWEKSVVTFLLMLVFSTVDIASLYLIFSDVLTQSPVFLFIFVGVTGLILSFLPILLARLARLRYYRMAQVPNLFFGMIIGVFGILIGAIFYLRFATKDMDYTNDLLQGIGGIAQQTTPSSSPAALPMVLILCFVPVCTAVVNFFLAWLVADPLKKEIQKLERCRMDLFEGICELESVLAEYSADLGYKDRLIEEEREKYMTKLFEIQAQQDYLAHYVRVELAKHLQEPAAITALSVVKQTGNPRILPFQAKFRKAKDEVTSIKEGHQ